MARLGWRVRVAVRRPNEAVQVTTYGSVGQVEPVLCNIRDDASVRSAMAGADAVVNCVGILTEHGRNSFDAVHNLGASRVARIATEERVGRLVHISAIGADIDAESAYCRSKALGEVGVLEHFPGAIVLRPSVIFGPEDQFFNRFARMTALGPVLPILGGDTKFQPVYVDDVAQAVTACVLGQAETGCYELGGPDVMTLRAGVALVLDGIQKRRLVVGMPFVVGRILGGMLDVAQGVTVGLFHNTILTKDQARNLGHDNVVAEAANGFRELGITPAAATSILPEYLWVYRTSGQFAVVKASAKNMKS